MDKFDPKSFSVGVEIIIRTISAESFDCTKILGVLIFQPHSQTFFEKAIKNFPLQFKFIRDKKTPLVIGTASGSLTVTLTSTIASVTITRPAGDETVQLFFEKYMNEFYRYVDAHPPIDEKLRSFHTPMFLSAQGPALPGYMFYRWRHINDRAEIYNIFKEAVALHPEFSSLSNFYDAFRQNIGEIVHMNAVETFASIFHIRQYSSLYVADTVKVADREYIVDQYSSFSEQHCSDCEDGCCYAAKIWNVLRDNGFADFDADFEEIRRHFVDRYVFTVLTLYCTGAECHVVPALISKALVTNMIQGGGANPNIVDILILETTAPTSPFQFRTPSAEFEQFRNEKFVREKEVITTITRDVPGLDVISSSLDEINGRYVSDFYLYVTNILIPLTDEYGYTSFLPVKNKNGRWAVPFFDLFNSSKYRWIGRAAINSDADRIFMTHMDNTLPVYDLKLSWKKPDIKISGAISFERESLKYVRINVYDQKGADIFMKKIGAFIRNSQHYSGYKIIQTDYAFMIYLFFV